MRGEGQQSNEGPCISKEDLREVQGHQPPWGGPGDLRERKAQAAPGLVGLVRGGNSTKAGNRKRALGNNKLEHAGFYSLLPNPYSPTFRG